MFYRVDKVFKSLYMIDNQMKLISEKRYGCLVTLVVPSFMISDRRIVSSISERVFLIADRKHQTSRIGNESS